MNDATSQRRATCAWLFFLVGYMATYLDAMPLLYRVVASGTWTFNPPSDEPVLRLYGMLLNGVTLGALGTLGARPLERLSVGFHRRLAVTTGAFAVTSLLLVLWHEIQHWMLTLS